MDCTDFLEFRSVGKTHQARFKREGQYTVNVQVEVGVGIPTQCLPLLKNRQRTSGPHRVCTRTTVRSWYITETEGMHFLRRLYRLFGSHNTAWQTLHINESDQRHLLAITPYKHD